MNVNDIYEKVKMDYPDARLVQDKRIIINTHRTFDGYAYLFCGIIVHEGRYLIVDNASFSEDIDYEYDHDGVLKILNEYDVRLDKGGYLETPYYDNSDIERFFDCLMELGEKYSFWALREIKEALKKKHEIEMENKKEDFMSLDVENQKEIILEIIKNNPDKRYASALREETGANLSTILKLLQALVDEGLLIRTKDGFEPAPEH